MKRSLALLVTILSLASSGARGDAGPPSRDALIEELGALAPTDPLGAADHLIRSRAGLPAEAFRALDVTLDHQRASIARARSLRDEIRAGNDIAMLARIATGAREAGAASGATIDAVRSAFDSFARADRSMLPDARQFLLETAIAFVRGQTPSRTAVCEPVAVYPAFAFDLAGCDTTYTADAALIVDVGGDDTYLNNAGGSASPLIPVAALIDAGGNDTYRGGNGGGSLGTGFLLDLGGDDEYLGRNGGGVAGVGFLLDEDGNDRYVSGSYGGNGGGVNGGSGMLIDRGSGADHYEAPSSAGNGGGVAGIGHLIDGGGSDTYLINYDSSYGSGANGGGNFAGRGFLFDHAGDDTYRATYGGGNGGSYGWEAAGFLYDGGGNDDYFVDDGYGANGGSAGGAGMLIDDGGDDRYWSTGSYQEETWRGHSGVNGGASANFLATPCFGALIDGSGNDSYEAGNNGVNGGASAGLASIGVAGALIDGGGDDRYLGGGGAVNGGLSSLYIGNVHGSALLLDENGNDSYVARYAAVNGGGGVGLAALVDRGGRDHYVEDSRDAYDETVLAKEGTGAQIDL